MNFISDVLSQKPQYRITIFTSVNSSPYANQNYHGVKIRRFGSVSENSILRYSSYILYNLFTTITLFLTRPDVLIVYESLSIFPAFIYSLVFKHKKIHVHYHEYLSLPEKENASRYMKFLFRFEEKLLKKSTCSQTNEDRKALFLKDNPYLVPGNVKVYPNLPPKYWWDNFGIKKMPWVGPKIKFVHVGVLDSKTMYLKELLDFVINHAKQVELTFYSQDISSAAADLIAEYPSESIHIKEAVNYGDLPQLLMKYDVGLVLYKGHNPNYTYNIPNKVFEYLSSGLKVLASKKLLSIQSCNIADVIIYDLSDLDSLNIQKLKSRLAKMNESVSYYRGNFLDIL